MEFKAVIYFVTVKQSVQKKMYICNVQKALFADS